ncbi:MAG: PD-(D/E)XK nuclease family protein, partial [Sulfurimicrobium sp.]
ELGRLLRETAGVDTLLLPRFATLRGLAEEVDVGRARLAVSCRQALIYRALRDRGWFRPADLWHVSAELLRLFDEITLCQVSLPSSYEPFLHQLEQAYRARSGSPLQFEARLVHEMWHALSASASSGDGALDDAVLYHLQLAQLAETAVAPLYAVGLNDLVPMESTFLELYANSCPLMDARPGADSGSLNSLLSEAWADTRQSDPLHDRASAFHKIAPASPLSGQHGRLFLCGASSLEEEAESVAFRVGQWLAQGKAAIAVVVQDRLVARRARALLERAAVLVADETGWTLSTTSASTVVMRWLDNLDSRFHYQDLLDLLKSPFIFTAWEPARRRHGVFRLEQLIRKHSVVSHLNRYRALAGEEEEVIGLLQALAEAQKLLEKRKARALAEWLQGLLASLDVLQIRAGLQRDPAGEQLLQLLDRLRHELASDATSFSYSEWRQWLNQQLEEAVFRDDSITSPVVFTHLAACRLRRFEGVVIAGADASHLPGQGRESVFFNQAVRAQLGLPDRRAALEIERQNLTALIDACPEVWVTWQARKNGEPNPLSPWFERLEIFHVLAYGESLKVDSTDHRFQLSASSLQSPALAAHPAPALPAQLVPATLSASGYNSLVACPYQFYARHALRLNELDEVSTALEKRDYGEYVHDILHRFHRVHPVLSGQDAAMLQQGLQDISREVFARAIEADFVSHAWALRWDASIPGYISWQLAREQEGWRWREGELTRTLDIPLAGARSLVLRGRLDRVDSKGAALAVLDYKTQSAEALKKKLKPASEDVQLPCYALLLGEMPRQAAFVAVDEETVRQVEADEDIAELAEANRARLRDMFNALYQGAPLPAQGTSQVCEYCEMRGLCRKDYWNA